jgi:hypothetical protein
MGLSVAKDLAAAIEPWSRVSGLQPRADASLVIAYPSAVARHEIRRDGLGRSQRQDHDRLAAVADREP